jgi:hypothetical protein
MVYGGTLTVDFYIPLADDQADNLVRDLSIAKTNKVFRQLWNIQEGDSRKFVDGQPKTFRYNSEGKIFGSRYYVAEQMEWESEEYASKFLKNMRKNTTASRNNEKVYFYLLDKVTDNNGTRCWRVSEEKIAKSIISATETYLFDLSKEEKEVLRKVSRKRREVSRNIIRDGEKVEDSPELLVSDGNKIYYSLLHSVLVPVMRDKGVRDSFSENERDILNQLFGKYREEMMPDKITRGTPAVV